MGERREPFSVIREAIVGWREEDHGVDDNDLASEVLSALAAEGWMAADEDG